jgi:hypothetical protein
VASADSEEAAKRVAQDDAEARATRLTDWHPTVSYADAAASAVPHFHALSADGRLRYDVEEDWGGYPHRAAEGRRRQRRVAPPVSSAAEIRRCLVSLPVEPRQMGCSGSRTSPSVLTRGRKNPRMGTVETIP